METKSETRGQLIRQQLKPTGGAIAVLAGILLLMLGFTCSIAAQSAPPEVVGIFCMGPLILLPFISLAFVKPPASRFYIFMSSAVSIGLAGLVSAILVALSPDEDAAAGVGFLFVIPVPFALTLLIPGGLFLNQTFKRIRTAVHDFRVRQTAVLLNERGEITFSEMALDLNVAPAQVDNLLDEARIKQLFNGVVYPPFQRAYTQTRLRERLAQIGTQIQERGQQYLDDLAIELNVPVQLLTDWIYQLVRLNQFTGYINWETAVLYSVAASQLRGHNQCPNCTGQLALDGERVRCTHCGAEVLVGGKT